MSSFRGKILVIRGGAIGDFILTLPAISALRAQFPDAFLEVLGYPHIVQLAQAGKVVDRVQSIEARALAGFFARNGTLEEDLRDYFSEFDLIISYLYDPDEIFKTNLARCTTAQFIGGPHRPAESGGVHATQVFLKPLERLAIFEADPVPRLSLGAAANSKRPLALHPGSGSESKNWPEEKWAELLQHLISETPFNLLLVGGEAEGERLQDLAAALPPTRLTVAQSLPLVDLGRMLERSCAFIGHDSGISHLAAALGLPGLVLWGDTVESVWRPPSEKIKIVHHAGKLADLSVDDVMSALGQLIEAHGIARAS
jgi:heptosyltransferase-3